MEYDSRGLTAAEQKWAQIEKETISLVFGLERFHQYTYGRRVMEIITIEPLKQS